MNRTTAAMRERTAAYALLRDSSVPPIDAGRQIGVGDRTQERYERWYRAERGLPPGRPCAAYGER